MLLVLFLRVCKIFFLNNMLPETATTVQQYITKISYKMTSLPITSVIVLFAVIFLMIKRLEITLNKIFYANRQRPMLQSLLVYWALMTMGPLLMGFVFISSTYTYIYGVICQRYWYGTISFEWLIAYFLNSRFFCCLQDIT